VPFSLKLCPRIRRLRSTSPAVTGLNSDRFLRRRAMSRGHARRKMILAGSSGVSASCYGYMEGISCRESMCEIEHLDFE
jgi:hypothetical protein